MLSGWKLCFAVCLFSPALVAQQTTHRTSQWFPATPIANPSTAANTPATQSEMLPQVAPVFVEDGKTTSSLVIVNNSAISAGATISVRGLSGTEAMHTHIPLEPHEQQEISLQSLLSGVQNAPTIGSVTVSQDPELKGLTVVSQLLITNQRGALPSYVDEELAMPVIGGSTTLRGVADESLGSALIAVTSIVGWTQKITLHCMSQNNESKPAVITLPAEATVLISSCSGQTVSDLESYSSGIIQHPQHGIQGYELVTDGGIGTIAAFGLAAHSRNQDPVYSGIPFTDPATIHAANSVFAGVPFGAQPALPDGIYAPRISFTNFSAHPAHITVSLVTTPPGDPSSASVTAASPQRQILQQLTIVPRRTSEFTLSNPGSQSGLQQSLIVETDRNPGEVLSKVVSRSDGNLFQIELLGKDQMDEDNGGSHPWSINGDSVAHLLLFNYSDNPRVFGVGVSNGAIVWDKKYTLVPYETREISINELIQDEVPDDKGQILSPLHTSGVVNWMVPDSGEGTGRLMVTSHSQAIARNFSCGNFIVVCGSQVWTNFSSFPINSIAMAGYTAEPQFCDEFSPSQCTGGSSVSSGSASYNWSIGATSVVRPNTSSDQYAQSPNLYGVGVGTGSSSVAMTAGSCSSYGYPPGPTVVPTVSFSGIPSVAIGATTTTNVTVTPSSNTTPISLSITSPAAIVSPTGTFTQNTGVIVKGMSAGMATITATVPNPEGGNPIPVGSTTFPVIPSISGSNPTVWWFRGQNPASSTYPVSVTLTSSAGSSTTWSVSQSDSKVNLSASTGAQITVSSTGQHFSAQNNDISITATANGEQSAPFTITAKTPWKLTAVPPYTGCNPTPYSYNTELQYNLVDNLSITMSNNIGWNEVVAADACENGSNWCNWAIATSPGTTNPVIDDLSPPTLDKNPTPAPTCTGSPNGTTRYRSASQSISVGTSTAGSGVLVQTDYLGYYGDHGQHDSIQSPGQPPQ